MFLKLSPTQYDIRPVEIILLLLLSLFLLNGCDNANHQRAQIDYSKQHPATEGGTDQKSVV